MGPTWRRSLRRAVWRCVGGSAARYVENHGRHCKKVANYCFDGLCCANFVAFDVWIIPIPGGPLGRRVVGHQIWG